MCGIAGVIERNVRSGPLLASIVKNMISTLKHRGPDASGIWVDEITGIGIGHQRLSIIDPSEAGAQPMVSGPLTISYNGEIYNANELRSELKTQGVKFQSHSDTEVVIKACENWGILRTTEKLIGMFAFAIWDRQKRCLYLVRDRIGIKPLYYCALPERFSFASELKGLHAHPNFDTEIDHSAVELYFALSYIPTPLSIYRKVKKLEPGMILRVDFDSLNDIKLKAYWTLEEAAQKGISDRFHGTIDEATDELENLLSDAVNRRLISDVPVGAFLSGGIDSSIVVALMQRQSITPVRTYSIGFQKESLDEAPYARAIAQHIGTDHYEYYIGPEELRRHGPEIMVHHDEPFADQSLLPTYFLSRLARTQVTVALSGDGGDEIFGGYSRHLIAGKLLEHSSLKYGPALKNVIHHIIPVLPRPIRAGIQYFFGMNPSMSSWLSSADMKTLSRTIENPDKIHHFLAYGNIVRPTWLDNFTNSKLAQCQTLSPSERQQYIDSSGYLPDDILTKVDRASMAVSLEVRIPILDHRIIEFSFRLPDIMKARGSDSKYVLRQVLARHVPRSLFERPKQGFVAPIHEWMAGPLAEWVSDLSVDKTIQENNLIDPKYFWKNKNSPHENRKHELRKILLAAWCKTHI